MERAEDLAIFRFLPKELYENFRKRYDEFSALAALFPDESPSILHLHLTQTNNSVVKSIAILFSEKEKETRKNDRQLNLNETSSSYGNENLIKYVMDYIRKNKIISAATSTKANIKKNNQRGRKRTAKQNVSKNKKSRYDDTEIKIQNDKNKKVHMTSGDNKAKELTNIK